MDSKDFLQKNLIDELGLRDLPENKKQELIMRIGDLIQQNIVLRILGELNEADKEEFDKVLAAKSPQKTLAFLQAKLPNFEEIIKEEISKFKESAIAKMQAITGLNA